MILAEAPRFTHEPVLLSEVLDRLVTDRAGLYLDATLGLGGHAEAVLKRLAPSGKLLGVDADPEALSAATARLEGEKNRFHAELSNFRDLASVLEREHYHPLAGALFDLGVSSLQLDKPERGFSFRFEGPLDMRLGPDSKLTAETIVNRWPPEQITLILKDYGEEREADRIARAIVARRGKKPFLTTTDLAALIESIVPRSGSHPATRTFQALRIAVNQELDALPRGLESALSYLKPGGRLCVITFHSLEDRIVKNTFASFVAQNGCAYIEERAERAILPAAAETQRNPRARSAKLRVIEKKQGGQRS